MKRIGASLVAAVGIVPGTALEARAADAGLRASAAYSVPSAPYSPAAIRLDSRAIAARAGPEPGAPSSGTALSGGPDPFRYEFERGAGGADMATEDLRNGSGQRPAGESALTLAPAMSAPRTGWHWSGRVGPLRWLGPLDGEGGTSLRLGGRAPGQPRMPGMGLLNVGIHYSFE